MEDSHQYTESSSRYSSHNMGGRVVLAVAASCLASLAVSGANLPYGSL